MKLKLIGTGSIIGEARSACSLIDEKILIDCGNGILKTLTSQEIDINNIKTILITHLHADHFFDLPFFLLVKNNFKPNEETKIYCPKGTEEIIKHLCNDYVGGQPNLFEKWKYNSKILFEEFDNLNDEEIIKGYFVNSYFVEHGKKKPAYGYVIRKDNKSIGFSGDSTYCENVKKIIEISDVSVLDMSHPKGNEAHMGVEDIEYICKKFDKKIVATHMSDQARKLAKELNIKNLIIPNDGDEIEI